MTIIDDQPIRDTGTCARCEHHTNDGVVHLIETGSGPGGRVLVCADVRICNKRKGPDVRRYSL